MDQAIFVRFAKSMAGLAQEMDRPFREYEPSSVDPRPREPVGWPWLSQLLSRAVSPQET